MLSSFSPPQAIGYIPVASKAGSPSTSPFPDPLAVICASLIVVEEELLIIVDPGWCFLVSWKILYRDMDKYQNVEVAFGIMLSLIHRKYDRNHQSLALIGVAIGILCVRPGQHLTFWYTIPNALSH